MCVSGQSIELCDDELGTKNMTCLKCLHQLRAISLLAALDLDKLLRKLTTELPSGPCEIARSDELASSHSITSSARASNAGGASMPSAFAVLRLMTSSNFVGSWI